ncbi:MAG: hypothetical protein Q4D55_12090, partial [Eubacteriales bacterium]|nr:hypothetical protein [Eubacteriales bacterium]
YHRVHKEASFDMVTSVFFTNNYIRVVVGTAKRSKAKVSKICSCEIPQGCLINGLITEEQELSRVIKELWETNKLPRKGVRISTESSRFTLKTIKIPDMKPKKMREYVRNEFPEVENPQDMIFDYQLISRDKASKMNEVMAVMTEKELVESFVELFASLGISIASMTPSRCALIEMTRKTRVMGKDTGLLLLVEGNDLRSNLYVDGKYTYATKRRLFSERGSEALAAEVTKGTSEIQQFMMAQKIDSRLKNVFIAGLDPQEEEEVRRRIQEIDPSLTVVDTQGGYVRMPKGTHYGDYVSPVSDLIMGKDGPNFVEAGRQERIKKDSKAKSFFRLVWPALVVLIGLGGASGAVVALNLDKEGELDSLEEYCTDPTNLLSYEKALEMEEKVNGLSAVLNQIRGFNEIRSSYPWASTQVMGAVERASGDQVAVTVTSYNSQDGNLVIVASASNVSIINQYIDALEATGLFDSVAYTGYTLSQQGELERYTVNASCHLAANAGKRVEKDGN